MISPPVAFPGVRGVLAINGAPVDAVEFAWDRCHHLYLIGTAEDRRWVQRLGYGKDAIRPVFELPAAWDSSCPLRAIAWAGFRGPDPAARGAAAAVRWMAG